MVHFQTLQVLTSNNIKKSDFLKNFRLKATLVCGCANTAQNKHSRSERNTRITRPDGTEERQNTGEDFKLVVPYPVSGVPGIERGILDLTHTCKVKVESRTVLALFAMNQEKEAMM